MDSGSGSNNEGCDLALKYCTLIEGNRNDTICNFCGMVIKSGGITRFKFHLSCDAPNPGGPLTTRQPTETLVNVG